MSKTFRLSSCTVDLNRGRVERDGQSVRLTTREAELLAYLAARPGSVVSRDELYEQVWRAEGFTQSRALDHAIYKLRVKIEADPSTPQHILSTYGEGYRFQPQSSPAAEGARSPSGPAAAASQLRQPSPPAPVDGDTHAPRTNLTPDRARFLGRQYQLSALTALFGGGARVVTLLGPPGIGKTRLARCYGLRFLEEHGDDAGAWFCDLSEADSGEAVAQIVGRVLGLTEDRNLETRIGSALSARGRVLLILDNFEQLIQAARSLIERWHAEAPQVLFLVTSREPLQLEAERLVDIPPLSEAEAAELFIERVRKHRPAYISTEAEEAIVVEIVRRLEMFPLAIELAAARALVLPPADLLERLSTQLPVLTRVGSGRATRHASMRQTIAWSWNLLEPWEQQGLIQCCVFRGGFTLEAAEAVLDLSGSLEAPSILDVIHSLREKSWLHSYEEPSMPGELRFSLYACIRELVSAQIADPTSQTSVEARHAAYYLELWERQGSPWEAARPGRLALERANLHAIHQRFISTRPEIAVRALLVLMEHWEPQRDADVRYLVLLRQVLGSDRLDPVLRLRTRLAIVEVRLWTEPTTEESASLLEQELEALLEEARQLRDGRLESRTLSLLGDFRWQQGGHPEALARFQAARAIDQATGNRLDEGRTLWRLGRVYADLGRNHDAQQTYQAAQEIFRELGDSASRSTVLGGLGDLHRHMDRPDEAEACYLEALSLVRAPEHRAIEIAMHGRLGSLYLGRGDLSEAARRLQAACIISREAAAHSNVAFARSLLGVLSHLQGSYPEASQQYQAALSLAARWFPGFQPFTLSLIVALEADRGRLTEARGLLGRLTEGPAQLRFQRRVPQSLLLLFEIGQAHIDLATAREATASNDPGSARRALASAKARLETVEQHPALRPGDRKVMLPFNWWVLHAMQLLRDQLERCGIDSEGTEWHGGPRPEPKTRNGTASDGARRLGL